MTFIRNNLKKVALAVSGGVDSATAGLLLKKKGFEVIGVFMKNWDEKDDSNILCTNEDDKLDAQYVCNTLNVPFKEVSFVKEYWSYVFQDMIKNYTAGLTPNPDILCNSYIKFDCFLRYCLEVLPVDAIATGHYARSSFGPFMERYSPTDRVKLLKAVDSVKDQSFFLSKISQSALQRTMFPLGEYTKNDVKKMASEVFGDRISMKKESMGICFIGSKYFNNFINKYIADKPGTVIDVDNGKVIGKHNGLHHYTIGQYYHDVTNTGSRIIPYYVATKNIINNNLYAAQGHDHSSLYVDALTVCEMHWICGEPPIEIKTVRLPYRCQFRYSHGKPLIDCAITKIDEGEFFVHPDGPLYAVSPGQFASFYREDECLGCGKINLCGPSLFSLKYYDLQNVSHWIEEIKAVKSLSVRT